MQKSAKGIQPEEIIEIIRRRRWWVIVPFFLSMITGVLLAFLLPNVYKAEALILVQPQEVPTNYVQPIVTTGIDSRIKTISQQVLSRTNLEKIIEAFNLFQDPKYQNVYIEDKIENLRKRISVSIIGEENQRYRTDMTAFSISFEGNDPENVMKVTNTLTSYFINENLKVREVQAIGTTEFLDEELSSIRKELIELEEKLKEYREKYMGGLPEQLGTNLRILDRLHEQLNRKQVSLSDAKNRLTIIKFKISEDEQSLLNAGVRVTRDGQYVIDPGKPLNPDQAKALLAQLEARYTERHPDVVRLKKMILDFEAKNEKDAEGISGEMRRLFGDSRVQLAEIQSRIEIINKEISQLKTQIWIYQKRVENTPKREQELFLLQRDYENNKNTYSSLLNRKLEADMTVSIEKKQKGEQLYILDSARLPEKPISPNMKILFVFIVGAGLHIGLGLVFLLEYLDNSFRSSEDVESFLEVPVLATLPIIYQKKDLIKQRFYNFLSVFFIALSIILFTGFAILSFNGVAQTIELAGSFNVL